VTARAQVCSIDGTPQKEDDPHMEHHKRKTELERDAIEQEIVRFSLTPKLNPA
jgi:hypothetical protein